LGERLNVVQRQAQAQALADERIDITLPGSRFARGSLHPITVVIDEIVDIFWGMGFEIARGPDIEDVCVERAAVENPHFASADPHDGKPQAAASGRCAGSGVPAR
jgi:phenylalanyl-tRNA synthetase alpha subunit